MNCKDYLKNGSIFLETMLALAISALILSSVFSLQLSVFQRVVFNTYSFSRFVGMGVVFQEALQDRLIAKEVTHYEKKIVDPEQTITLDVAPVDTKSSLARFRRLFAEKAVSQWTDMKGSHQVTMLELVFVPEKKKQNEKEEKEQRTSKGAA